MPSENSLAKRLARPQTCYADPLYFDNSVVAPGDTSSLKWVIVAAGEGITIPPRWTFLIFSLSPPRLKNKVAVVRLLARSLALPNCFTYSYKL